MEFLVILFMQLRIVISNISLLLIPVVLACPGMLWAAPEDTVQAYVSASVTHDDNLLRLSKDVDPMTASGQPSAADTIKQSTLGVKVDWKQGRQEVILDASISESRYTRFTSLNYQATNLQSRWNWQLGNNLIGNIGYNRSTSLSSFAELQHLAKNLSTQQNEFFDGAWQVNPSLRLNGALTHATYSVASNSVYGNDSMTYTAGAYFTPPGGNEIGIRGVHQVQEYPVLEAFSGVPVNNGFAQNQLLATFNWFYSGHIRVNGQAGVVNRAHNQLSERDFSGKTMRGTLTWFASGKGQVELTAWNEIDAYDNLTTNYTQSKGFSLGPTWRPTGKMSVSARLQHLERDFLGDPVVKLFPGLSIPVRKDTINSASLSLNYQPVRSVNISASIQNERRYSNQLSVNDPTDDPLVISHFRRLSGGSKPSYIDNTINLSMSFGF